jgi:hypothetical protein
MTNEQINKAIAEPRGWRFIEDDPYYEPYWEDPAGNMIGAKNTVSFPNCAGCLNAMHEAEEALNPIKAAEYARILTSIAWQSEQPVFAPMTATARQRAEAFLRTIGKWEEEA